MVANRPLSEAKVLAYGLDMEAGTFSMNGETIKFDAHGRLFDGQHRLRACILAGVPFQSVVVRGIDDPEAFVTVDTGKVRTHSDVFGIDGWANSAVTAAATNLVKAYVSKAMTWNGFIDTHRYKRGSKLTEKIKNMPSRARTPNKSELLEFANGIRDELVVAVRFSQKCKATKLIPGATIAALYLLFRRHDVVQAEQFFQDLATGIGLEKGDPVLTLREKIISTMHAKLKMSRTMMFGYVIKAWNKRRAGGRLTQLRVVEGEVFPVIE